MKIKIYLPEQPTEQVDNEEIQRALDKLTKNCKWYTEILKYHPNGLITVTSFTNAQCAPVVAAMLLLCAEYPNIFKVNLGEPIGAIPNISLEDKQEGSEGYRYTYRSIRGTVSGFVKGATPEEAQDNFVANEKSYPRATTISFSIQPKYKDAAIEILSKSSIEV